MNIYVYKIHMKNGEECLAVGQVQHDQDCEFDLIECSQPIEVPDNSSIDDIVKFVKCCEAKRGETSH